MPKVKANNITMNYDQQGTGEPLILIPYLSADHACYGFQVAEYAKHFTCISLDLRGTGETDKPEGVYSTELLADDVAAFMRAVGIPKAHISGLSLGAAIGMWLAPKYPDTESQLSRITAPTLITFGRHDVATSTRFADRMKGRIRNSEMLIFEECSHTPIYERVEEFNAKTLSFLKNHTVAGAASASRSVS